MNEIVKIKIADIGHTVTGKTPSSNNPEDFGSEFMFVTPSDSFDSKMMKTTERYLSEEGVAKLSNKLLPPKSIMITCIGSAMGKTSMNKTSCVTNQQINSVVPSEKYFQDYIYYAIRNNYKLLRNASTGSTALPLLNKTDFDLLELPLHTNKDTQQKIASVLSALDSKIELNNRINAELEAMAKTIYDYWFVQFDFPYDFAQGRPDKNGKPYKSSGGKMVWNEELKREVPEGWEVKELGGIVSVGKDQIDPAKFPDKEFKHLSIPTFDVIGTFALEFGKEIGSSKFTVQKYDILVSKLNPWFSRVYFPLDTQDLICTTEMVIWRCQNNQLKNFMYLLAMTPSFISYCTKSATGTSNSHKRVNPSVMMQYKIAFNPIIASSYGEIINSLIIKKMITSQENQQLASLRDWLLPMLMNGQVRVG